MSNTILRTIKVRLLPTPEQEQKFYQFSGACRFIWNTCLEYQIMHYNRSEVIINTKMINDCYSEFNKLITNMRKMENYKWLNDINRHSLGQILRDQKKAYNTFFRHLKSDKIHYTKKVWKRCDKQNRMPYQWERKWHPLFKKKKDNKFSIPFDSNDVYFNYNAQNELYVQLNKIGKIKIQTNLYIPTGSWKESKGLVKNIRIKLINNKWILFGVIERDKQVVQLNNDKVFGIDLGIKILAACTCGKSDIINIYHNINKSKKIKIIENKINKLNKKLCNQYNVNKKKNKNNNYKYKTRTKRIQKTINKLNKLYYYLHNIRIDYLHKISRNIINQKPRAIVLENLNLNFLIQSKNMAKSALNQLLGEFRRQIIYKAEEFNIEIIIADKLYPSSQLCSNCGSKHKIKLNDRIYKCNNCGYVIDRDCNAAINLEKYGIFHCIASTKYN